MTKQTHSLLTKKDGTHIAMLAGAGTGKTGRITADIAALINTPGVEPKQILAVTFSRKATNELRQRIKKEVGSKADGITISTFHALGASIIRQHGHHLGVDSAFTVLHESDIKPILRGIIEGKGLGGDVRLKDALKAIERLKCEGILPESDKIEDKADKRVARIYAELQSDLLASNSMTFNDLILYALQILREQSSVRQKYASRFRFIYVDEFQDTNMAQYKLLKRLAGKDCKLFVVGDDDQSIFSWRHVRPRMMDKFVKDFGIDFADPLTVNHRSTVTIIEAANALIKNNKDRIDKKLVPASTSPAGRLIRVRRMIKQEEEAKWIAEKINKLRVSDRNKNKNKGKSIAILCRLKELFPKIETQLRKVNIPYYTFSRESLFATGSGKLLLNYLRTIENNKNNIALDCIINRPSRYIGKKKIKDYAKQKHISLWDAALKLRQEDDRLSTFIDQFKQWQKYVANHSAQEVAKRIIKDAKLEAYFSGDKEEAAALKQFQSIITPEQSLPDFLNTVIDDQDNDDAKDTSIVSVMTMHAAKGLQFDVVFLPAWEEGRVPDNRSDREEERRLAYVAITRAKERIFISNVLTKRDKPIRKLSHIEPSDFIREMDDYVERKISKEAKLWRTHKDNYEEPTFDIEIGDIVSHNPYSDDNGDRVNYGFGEVLEVLGRNIRVRLHNAEIITLKKSAVTKAILPKERKKPKT